MHKYRQNYDPQGKPYADYYEQKFEVYLGIANCDLYLEDDKRSAFKKAYSLVEETKEKEIDSFRGIELKDVKLKYSELCKKYNVEFNLSFNDTEHIKENPKISESDFIKDVKKSKTKNKILRLYKSLHDYKNGIILQKKESWRILVNKTFEVMGDIQLFKKYMEDNYFPHFVFWTSNSEYLHFGLAAALKNINTRQEILTYLYKNTGHDGFVNIMKAFEVNGDRKMCLSLFKRFLRFCALIVD